MLDVTHPVALTIASYDDYDRHLLAMLADDGNPHHEPQA